MYSHLKIGSQIIGRQDRSWRGFGRSCRKCNSRSLRSTHQNEQGSDEDIVDVDVITAAADDLICI